MISNKIIGLAMFIFFGLASFSLGAEILRSSNASSDIALISSIIAIALELAMISLALGGIALLRSKIIRLGKNRIIKKVATGYSWKSLLFGVFYPMVRGDVKGLIIQFPLAIITFGLSWFVVPFFYNKRYITRLLEDGYIPEGELSEKFIERMYK